MPNPVFTEERFPDDINYAPIGSTQWLVEKIEAASGKHQRILHRSKPVRRYNVSHRLRSLQDKGVGSGIHTILEWYNATRGATGFRLKDWTDYYHSDADYVSNSQPIGTSTPMTISTGDGVSTLWQITKTYSTPLGTATAALDIRKPVAANTVIYIDGSPLIEGTDYTLDSTTGIINLGAGGTPHGPLLGLEVLSWTGTFDIPVIFDPDSPLEIEIEGFDAHTAADIVLIEDLNQ